MPHLSESFGISGLLALTTTKQTRALSREHACKLTRPLFILLIICVFSSAAFGQYGGGSGTAEDPYQIATKADLLTLAGTTADYSKCFILTADIDMEGQVFRDAIIAPDTNSSSSGFQGTAFTGAFDGNDFCIQNLSYYYYGTYMGLFGRVNPGGQIKNLGLENCAISISGGKRIGSLVGENNGSISHCYSTGSVSSYFYVGGLVGWNTGSINNCYSMASTSANTIVGGLVGWNYYGSISNCYSTGGVSGYYNAGGLVGSNTGSISNCYSTGSVSGFSNSFDVGGLAGEVISGGSISNCYSRGSVSGRERIGGLVGSIGSSSISNCYSTGSVSSTSYGGGLLGRKFSGNITNSFWDITTSGRPTSAGGTGKSTTQMKTITTFTSAGWDFLGETANGTEDIWRMCVNGLYYPKLSWQFPLSDFVCPDGVNFIDYAFFAEHWLQSIYGECGGVELTGDGKVNWVDFALFAEYWMLTGCGECGGADFTGDENVDLADLYVFATYWLGFEYAEVDLTNDGQVDLDDLREFTENWLADL